MHVIGNSLMNFHKYIHVTAIQIKKQNVTSTPGSLPVTNPASRTKCNHCSNFKQQRLLWPIFVL